MKLKFNFKLSLFILLIGLILYCCLGNNFYEGLDQQSSNQSGNELQSCITSCNTTCNSTAKKSNPHLQGTDIENYCGNQCNTSCNKIFGSEPPSAKPLPSRQPIAPNREPSSAQYIDSDYNVDSPVCPSCPSNNNYGTTSCKKEKPCPPCPRCPESAFKCKEVPDYDSTNTNYLPKPILNDFSKF